MKVVHKQEEGNTGLKERARQAEANGDLAIAEKTYLAIIKRNPHNQQAYNRLMIIYRKQRSYDKELEIINTGIKTFTTLHGPKATHNKIVKNLSAKLNRAFGLVDKKGNSLYDPGPVATWKRRKLVVEKRLKKTMAMRL
jgi:tetratricopeptide (TPR) repeat protein